jgi:hypothetical protein
MRMNIVMVGRVQQLDIFNSSVVVDYAIHGFQTQIVDRRASFEYIIVVRRLTD